MAEWYVSSGGKTHGPFSSNQLKQLADLKKIKPDTNVRLGADGKWTPAKNVRGLFESQDLVPAIKKETPHSMAKAVTTSRPPIMAKATQSSAGVARVSCPFCGEEILESAVKCRHCNEFVDGQSPSGAQGHRSAAPQHAVQVNVVQQVSDHRSHSSYSAEKRILPAFLLAFFLGGFGAHRFYTGNIGSAIAMLLMWLFGWMLLVVVIGVIPLMIVAVWAIVDLILLASGNFRDGNGTRITQWT